MFSWAKRGSSPPRAKADAGSSAGSSTHTAVGGQQDAPTAAVDVAVCCEHAAMARFAKEKLEAHG